MSVDDRRVCLNVKMSTAVNNSSSTSAISDRSEAILHNEFFLQSGKQSHLVCVTLTRDKIVCCGQENTNKHGDRDCEVALRDVLACRCLGGADDQQADEAATAAANNRSSRNSHNNKSKSKLADNVACLQVYAYPYNKKVEEGGSRSRLELNFVASQGGTKAENIELVQRWRVAILSVLHGVPFSSVHDLDASKLPPPRRLLVCINPFSGKRKAPQIFKQVEPIFREAGINLTVIKTERKGHGKQLAKELDIKTCDGIIIVSGDGLVYEMINGLMEREDREEAMKVPFGIIPGGSGNGLCVALLSSIGEQWQKNMALHAAFRIIKGGLQAKDLVRIETPGMKGHSFLGIAWGIIADIDIESERFRFLGDIRFSIEAVSKILFLRKKPARLSYLPIDNPSKYSHLFQKEDPKTEKFTYTAVANGNTMSTEGEMAHHEVADTNKEHSKEDENLEEDVELPPLTEPVPSSWTVIQNEFAGVLITYMSHISKDFISYLNRPFDEGVIMLQYIDKSVSRKQLVNTLDKFKTGDYLTDSTVVSKLVKAFRLEPLNDDGILTVDGEQVKYEPIQGCIESQKCFCFL